jgi:hypothetical protein
MQKYAANRGAVSLIGDNYFFAAQRLERIGMEFPIGWMS